MQKVVIFSMASGFPIHQGQLTLMQAATSLSLLRTVWQMGGLTQIISVGDGSHMVVRYHHLMARSFWMAWRASIGHLLVIPSFATTSSHCFVFFLRYSRNFLHVRADLYVWFIFLWQCAVCFYYITFSSYIFFFLYICMYKEFLILTINLVWVLPLCVSRQGYDVWVLWVFSVF
jgi:hypothetical protein